MSRKNDPRTRRRGSAPRGLAVTLHAFAAALARRGVALPRHEVLAVMAEGCGARNVHEVEAAAAAGSLDPVAFARVGDAVGPDGAPLAAFRHPDGRVLALSADPGRHAPSPWGGIADLGADRAAGRPAEGAPRGAGHPAGVRIHVATVRHEHGHDEYHDWTEEGLDAQVAGYVRANWDEGAMGPIGGLADAEATSRYFDRCDRLELAESLETSVVDMPPPPSSAGRRSTAAASGTAAFPDEETRRVLAENAAAARAALRAHAAASGPAGGEDPAALLARDLAFAADDAGEADDPEDGRLGAGHEFARALRMALLERIEWYGDSDDGFAVEALHDEFRPRAARPAPGPLDAAVGAYAEARRGDRGRPSYEGQRGSAESDLLSDLVHLLWAEGADALGTLARGLDLSRDGDAPPARFSYDGGRLAEAEGRVRARNARRAAA